MYTFFVYVKYVHYFYIFFLGGGGGLKGNLHSTYIYNGPKHFPAIVNILIHFEIHGSKA